jgi:peptidoglycan/LPS O-acetylase OafA/YrhL
MSTERLRHRPELDGVRGLAIALVLVAHALYPTTLFAGGGVIGVQLFFVLSGFLITSILHAEWSARGKVDLRHFYARRARRLVPGLVAFLAVFAVWAAVADVARTPQILVSATYVANWARVGGLDLAELNHTWSLAVEEQFYLAWPLALIAIVKLVPRPGLVVAAVAAGLMVWRIWLATSGADWDRLYYATDTNATALLAGAALALLGVPEVRFGRWIGAIAVMTLLGLSLTMTVHSDLGQDLLVAAGFPLATIGGVALIVAALNVGAAWLAARPLVFLGAISYGLYLWHTGINRIAELDYEWPVEARLALIPIGIAISWLSLRWVESPFRASRQSVSVSAPVLPVTSQEVPQPS